MMIMFLSCDCPLQVVHRILEVPHRTKLLVVDRDTDEFLHTSGLACTEDLAEVMGTLSPRPSPGPTPSASPVPRGISPTCHKTTQLRSSAAADSAASTVAHGGVRQPSESSSAASDTDVSGQVSGVGAHCCCFYAANKNLTPL